MVDVWHPFTQLQGFAPLGTVVRARGAWLELADGRRVLDGIASWWVNVHGHCHPRITEAIATQAATFDQVILADFTHAPAATLAARLAALLPGDLDHVFFSDDGSTAVEVALKLAWQAQGLRGQGHRTRFVALEGGYHGDTLGAMRVGARDVFTAPFDGLLGPTTFLPWDDGAAAERFFEAEGHEVAVCIVEPVLQGAGGMRLGSPEALARLAAAARRAGVILVADEVATGFGRLGPLWACELAGVVPDLLCMSKGITGGALALGATGVRGELFDLFLGADKRRAFLHGHSYTGNPLACAAALASLDLFDEEDTLGRVRAIDATYAAWHDRLAALPGVRDVRHRGVLLAFDLEGGPGGYLDPVGVRVQRAALAQGLYVRPLGHVVYLLPPTCITPDELDWALGVLVDAVGDALRPRPAAS
ncbi:MAG: adenosylmethionine--8-amino-7-oxononanoate transaminase [Alphaproteobacteria bacterium]|nr:adenosylmethionine--8-amino-7-oxononanoate transaminase [Alphaproteobacteria bacterium]